MNSLTISIDRLEETVVDECASLIDDLTGGWRERTTWMLSGAQVRQIEAEVGVRITRLALRAAKFRPSPNADADGWESFNLYRKDQRPIKLEHPEVFGLALQDLDLNGVLAAALGLDR